MTGEFHLRLARPGEEDAIVQFLDAHWEWKLPLVHVPQFFEFYYRPFGGAPQFALALQNGRICAAAGFIRANAGENPDIWASIWAAAGSCFPTPPVTARPGPWWATVWRGPSPWSLSSPRSSKSPC